MLANGGKTTVVKMAVLPRTEKFCNSMTHKQFGAVRGRTEEKFSQEIWRWFGENPYLCAQKSNIDGVNHTSRQIENKQVLPSVEIRVVAESKLAA